MTTRKESEGESVMLSDELLLLDFRGDFWVCLRQHPKGAGFGCADARYAPHDQLGPLPPEYRERLIPRCGAPRVDGGRCRNPVPSLGHWCRRHTPKL